MGYTDSMAHYYDLSTPVALPDLGVVGGNPGTGANIASNPVGIHAKSICAEFNGNNSYYDLGDVAELNAVTAFTLAFWMRQDVLDVTDYIFSKYLDATHRAELYSSVDGCFYFRVADGASLWYPNWDYSTAITAGQWHHVAWVFDGSGAANADRLKCYVDAAPVTLTYSGVAVPAAMGDLTGADATIGATAASFDGMLDSFAIFTDPLTRLQVNDFKLATAQGRI